MDELPERMQVIILFIVGALLVMFADGLMYDNYNTKVSMATMHHEMKPVVYADPAPPSLAEYWSRWLLPASLPSDPDTPMAPDIVIEDGREVKVYRITMNNVLHELRPGKKMPMFSFNNKIPSDTIRVSEGDRVRVIFTNNGTDPHSIHWHGINNISYLHDGVPDLTQDVVMPGESFTYEWTAAPSGTKIYHCHVEAPHHMAMGMYGAIIIDPKEGKDAGNPFPQPSTHDRIFILSEFDGKHAHTPLPGEMMPMGPDGDLPWILTPGREFMMPYMPEITEFLVNGKSFPENPPLVVKEGDIVRMRIINIGGQVHTLHIHGHEWVITHRDGYPVPAPYRLDTFAIGPGERYDAWFVANNPGVWMVHDHGLANMANGYDPAGLMLVIAYDGITTEPLDRLIERVRTYNENIEHMDEDHGKLTPSTPVGGGHSMGGMGDGGGH